MKSSIQINWTISNVVGDIALELRWEKLLDQARRELVYNITDENVYSAKWSIKELRENLEKSIQWLDIELDYIINTLNSYLNYLLLLETKKDSYSKRKAERISKKINMKYFSNK